jgi:hypothetical protein
MKKITSICLLIIIFFSSAQMKAQQKTAGIYKIDINFNTEFIDDYVDNVKRGSSKGFSISILLPDTLIESIKTIAEDHCSKKLKCEAKCIYKTNKKGEKVMTSGWGHLEGMPTDRYKDAVAGTDHNYFVNINILIQTGGESVFLGRGYYSKLEPWVIASIKVFDRVKNEVYENKVSIKDFSGLKKEMIEKGGFAETYSELLGPIELFMIIENTMDNLIIDDNKGKKK